MVSLKQQANAARERVFNHMLARDPDKYTKGIGGTRKFKFFFPESPSRGAFMPHYYAAMHLIDDVVDGDHPVPLGETRVSYVERMIAFAEQPRTPTDDAEVLLLYCMELADRMGYTIGEETSDLLRSMLFDAKRQGTGTVFPSTELGHHFDMLDIRGTIPLMLKLFKEDPASYRLLEPLGTACRVMYNIRDFDEDVRAGLVNIPLEDYQRLGFTPEDLHRDSPPTRAWFREQSVRGLELLAQHQNNLPKGRFGWRARYAFPRFYRDECRDCFERVLGQN